MRETVLIQANKNATSRSGTRSGGLSITIGAVSNWLRSSLSNSASAGFFFVSPFSRYYSEGVKLNSVSVIETPAGTPKFADTWRH